MLASARTAAHDALCCLNPNCLKARAAGEGIGHDAAKARRYFSACRSLQRLKVKTPVRRQRPPREPLLSINPSKQNRSRSSIDLRKDVDGKAFCRLVCERLERIASSDQGSELSKLAKNLSRLFDPDSHGTIDDFPPLYHTFRQAYSDHGPPALESQIKYTLQGQLANARLTDTNLEDQSKLADIRYPAEWYPATRAIQRTIHLHVGPTNSGKTYQALQRLEQAKTGIYAGPLRLLAYEVYTRLNAKGKACHLITGDDRRIDESEEDAMVSCTVEMVPTGREVDVAVVDEIQMIGNEERGWAWSQALLGLKAKELHLCGEARTIPLIRELAAQMGDKLEIHHYERLSPLKAASRSLGGDLTKLRKGDCLVVFSRKEIHALKSEIERKTNRRVAIVYGSLPPETRAYQARLFNDHTNDYDYLVASDAIGMGLNLDIKRIIFESTWKFNGSQFEPMSIPHLKQIAGRAGRYRVAPQSKPTTESYNVDDDGLPPNENPNSSAGSGTVGLVTTLEQMDYARIRQAMQTEAEPIMTAGIFPPTAVLTRFAAYFPPGTPFSYILSRLHEISNLHPRYHLCNLRDQTAIAEIIEQVQGLTIADRIVFCAAPASHRLPAFGDIVIAFAQCVAHNTGGTLLEMPNLKLEILDVKVSAEKDYLAGLETLHKALILYIWLSYRFLGVFQNQDMAFYIKGMVEERINDVLAQVSSSRKQKMKTLRQLAMLEELGSAYGENKEALAGAKQEKLTLKQLGLPWEQKKEIFVNVEAELDQDEETITKREDMGPLWEDLTIERPGMQQEAAVS